MENRGFRYPSEYDYRSAGQGGNSNESDQPRGHKLPRVKIQPGKYDPFYGNESPRENDLPDDYNRPRDYYSPRHHGPPGDYKQSGGYAAPRHKGLPRDGDRPHRYNTPRRNGLQHEKDPSRNYDPRRGRPQSSINVSTRDYSATYNIDPQRENDPQHEKDPSRNYDPRRGRPQSPINVSTGDYNATYGNDAPRENDPQHEKYPSRNYDPRRGRSLPPINVSTHDFSATRDIDAPRENGPRHEKYPSRNYDPRRGRPLPPTNVSTRDYSATRDIDAPRGNGSPLDSDPLPDPYQPRNYKRAHDQPYDYGLSRDYGEPRGYEARPANHQSSNYDQIEHERYSKHPVSDNVQQPWTGYGQQRTGPDVAQPTQDFYNPQGQTFIDTQPGAHTAMMGGSAPSDYLIPSILVCLFCFWPTGLFAIIYSVRMRRMTRDGDMDEAKGMSNNARNCMFSSIVVGLCWIIAIVVIRFVFPTLWFSVL